jgi:hypothetical protein
MGKRLAMDRPVGSALSITSDRERESDNARTDGGILIDRKSLNGPATAYCLKCGFGQMRARFESDNSLN